MDDLGGALAEPAERAYGQEIQIADDARYH